MTDLRKTEEWHRLRPLLPSDERTDTMMRVAWQATTRSTWRYEDLLEVIRHELAAGKPELWVLERLTAIT